MRYSCLHTHTTFCDGACSVEAMCAYAAEHGFVSLGFSSHAPLPTSFGPPTAWHLAADRLEEYAAAVREARERWQGKLAVYLGLEVDYIPGVCGPGDGRFDGLGLDYVIGSVHYLIPPGDAEPFTVDGSRDELATGIARGYGGDAQAAVEAYWDNLTAMIHAGGFSILGHMDLIKKNNGDRRFFDDQADWYEQKSAAAVQALEGTDITVEINTGGLNRGSVAEAYPSARLLSLLNAARVPIGINADAHRCEHLGGHYEEARRLALAAGYRSVRLFNGHGWDQEALGTV